MTVEGAPARYGDLRALFINYPHKKSPERSHTRGLMDLSAHIMGKQGVWVEQLLHLARMRKAADGIPAHGHQRSEWDAGCRFDFENPEHR